MINMTLEEIYLDWVNNFITIKGFANHYDILESEADMWIFVCSKLYLSKNK